MAEELKKRSEVAKETTWATEDLYASDELWEEDFARAQEMIEIAKQYQGHLGDSAEVLYSYLMEEERQSVVLDSLSNYASRKHDEDTAEPKYQAMRSKLMSFYTKLGTAYAFAEPELVEIPEETYQEFYRQKPELEKYRRYIGKILRKKPHTLSKREEELVAAASEALDVASETFSVLNDADLKFPVIPDGEGGEVRITHGNYTRFLESKNREVRKAAFEAVYSVYDQFKNTSASLLYGQVKKLMFYAQQFHYNSTMEQALFNNEIPVAVYKNLIETVHANMDKMYRYVALRKKLLGVDELHMYDVYTPIVSGVDMKIPFDEAKKIVYEALAPMGEEYRALIKEGFEKRWIDVYENEGKRSGAYSAGAMVHPYVLLNYSGTLDSVFTLAHEMGHALHSWYSNHRQSALYSRYRIFVAEVASTCNEALLMHYLLEKTTDKKERAYLINHALEEFKGTLYRQAMFAEFEMMINEMAERGEVLTADVLSRKYHDLLALYFGKEMVLDPQIDLEWARIPHFYFDFYVYQDATGYSAATALSAKILAEGESAVKDYIKFLSGGCSTDPISLLKIAGVDMSTSKPIEQALSVFAGYLDEMENLVKEL